ncbi:MAG: hypothetical protein UCP83_01370 [Intestinibacter bartlettii]|jgi:hypothetical protein|nr:hypothetical protein [Intestinibacter bartlettii]
MKLNKTITKVMLGVALLGVGGATIEAVSSSNGSNVASASSGVYRTWEYMRVGRRIYRRSVLKGYAKNVGWVYDSVGPWQFYRYAY